MVDMIRVQGRIFGADLKTPVATQNAQLKATGTRAEAYKLYEAKDRDNKDDLLLRGHQNNNYFVLSADRMDFSAVGVGNRVLIDGMEADVIEVNNETAINQAGANGGQTVDLTRKEKSGWFSTVQKPVRMENAEVFAITKKEDLRALENRIYRDGKSNVVIQDDNSRNKFLVTADKIDFTSVGVGDKVTFGKTTGKVIQIDDQSERRPTPPSVN